MSGFGKSGHKCIHTHKAHTHKHTHTSTHIHTSTHTHKYTHKHTHTQARTHTHTHTHTCKYTDINTNIQVYTHCTNAHRHTHTQNTAIPDHVYKYKHDTLHIVWHETKIKICQLFTQMIQRQYVKFNYHKIFIPHSVYDCNQACENQPCECKLHQVILSLTFFVQNVAPDLVSCSRMIIKFYSSKS